MISGDGWLGAITAVMIALTGGMVRLIITTTRTETLLRAHMSDTRIHQG